MTPESPYKGLDAFGESDLDALLFFGREREREIVVANLIASRLTVLYGPTGVGKSSLLRAGVARSLRELPEEPLVVVFDHWGDDPAADLAGAIAEAAGEPAEFGLHEAVESAQRARDVYVILDQTEEYFVYHTDDVGFDSELARLVGEPLRVNVLLSLREDSLAKLDQFKPRIPGVYANSLRLDRLDRNAARAAILGPAEQWSRLAGEHVDVEPALVEAVLDGVEAGKIEHAVGGLGAADSNGRQRAVEAPYLQLVMQRLWEVERSQKSSMLRAETLETLGGARRVVADHLEVAVDALTPEQQDVAARLFTYLVTPSGTKISHDLPDLAEYAGVDEAAAAPVVQTLSRHRILRPDDAGRTEIFHDVLAGEVLAWRRRHAAESALDHERAEARTRHRRLAWLACGALVGFVLMALLTVFALTQRSKADAQAEAAQAHELEALADAELDRDPELSILLALEAMRLVPGESAEETLREALLESRVQRVVSVGESLLGAKVHGRDVLAVTANGDVVFSTGGTPRESISTGSSAVGASFADDGTALVTGRDGAVRVVKRDGSVTPLPDVRDATSAALSPDGTLAAIADAARVRLVEVSSGRVLETYPHRGAISAAISPDNRRVLTGGADDKVHVWSGQSGRRVHTLTDHTGNAVALAFSPDGRWVASASTDGSGRVWRTADWGLQATLGGHVIALTDVEFSADGEHVVTASRDGTARVLKTDSGAPLVVLSGHKDWVRSASFTGGSGNSVVTASPDGTARVWDTSFQPQLEKLAALGVPIVSVDVQDGRIRVGTEDGKTHVLGARSGEELRIEPGAPHPRRVVGPDGSTATIRRNVVMLRSPDGEVMELSGHRDRVRSVSFSSDGSLLATASRDHDVRIWEVATGRQLGPPLQGNSEVHDARFSPDGRWVITAAGRAGLFDLRSGTLIVRLQGHEGTLTSVDFGPTGQVIFTGGEDGTVRKYVCEICGDREALVALAERRVTATGRELTPEERERFLG